MDETKIPKTEKHEELNLKEAAKQIYADAKGEPMWWPEEILDLLKVQYVENGFIIDSPQLRNHTLKVTVHKDQILQTETYFFEVTEPSEETLGLVEKSSGMANDQKRAKEIYKRIIKNKI